MASEILVKINVESGQADVSLKKAKVSVDKLAAAKEKLAHAESDLAKELAVVNLKTKEQIQVNNQAAAQTIKNVNKGSGQFRTQVGLNNAILTEAGRAASDLRFGFNGVANNVGQIASLFGNLIQTSDNVGTSLRNLASSLMGTGGILIGIQLLIAYGDRIFQFFTGAEESVSRFQKGIDTATASLDVQIETFSRLISSLEKYGDIGKRTEDTNFLLAGSFTKFKTALKDINEGAKLEFTDIFEEKNILEGAEALEKYRELFLKFLKSKRDEAIVIAKLDATTKDGDLQFLKGSETRDKLIRKRTELLRKRLVLEKELELIKPEKEEGEGSLSDNLTQFLDLSKKIQAAKADVRKGAAIDDMDAIRIQGENEEIQLEAQAEVFLDKQKQRLEQKLITQEQYNESELQAQEELAEAIDATQEKTANRQLNLQGKRNENANQLDIESSFIREEIMLNEELMEDENLGRRAGKALSFQQERLNTEIASLKARLEAEELHVEQRAKLQKELSQAELKESGIRTQIADAEANAKIESLTLVSSALNVASKIAGESSKAGKAMAVSAALITTYLSANKAYLSQFNPIPTASSPVRGALAATIAVASGLANVKAILATNPAGQSNLGGGGASVNAPSFNVVGASATNQLAGAVAGQVNAPLRAYVVGSDISDQQELDRSIISTAGIG